VPAEDDKIGTKDSTYRYSALVDHFDMTRSAPSAPRTSSEVPLLGSPRLRLLPKRGRLRTQSPIRQARHAGDADALSREEPARAARDSAPVLVAGADPDQRADVLDQLARTLPESTRFQEVGALWEVLAQAPSSRIVILSGELDDTSAESLMRTLGHRHPELPVVSLAPRSPADR
jgi:hypothetical protein